MVDLVDLAAEYRGVVRKGGRLGAVGRGAGAAAAVGLGAGGVFAGKHFWDKSKRKGRGEVDAVPKRASEAFPARPQA